jgi:hypothetical protein
MKTTLSTIILEETIKASLSELIIDKDKDKDTTKIKPTPKPTPKTKISAATIATAIINSKSWIDDSEATLINAVNAIPDVKTFWEVNKIIQSKEGKTFSGYISTFIDNDEWDVWYPIIKHLTVIIPENQWKTVIKNTLDKTTGIAGLTKLNRSLAQKITAKLPATGVSGGESGFGLWDLGIYGLIGFLICKKGGLKCWDRFKKLAFPNKIQSGVEIANWIERTSTIPMRQNKNALKRIMKYELDKKRITPAEYSEMLSILNGESIMAGIPRQDLNRAFFNAVIKSWETASSSKPIKAGEAKLINIKVDDPTFTKVFYPKLQAIEDRILGKQSKKDNTNNTTKTPVKLVYRDIKKLGITKPKPNFKTFNMSRWMKLARQANITDNMSGYQKQYMWRVGDEFTDKVSRGIDVELAAKQAILDAYERGDTPRTFVEMFNEFPAVKDWLTWVSKNKSGYPRYKFYDRLAEFPEYDQWVFDMKNAGSRTLTKQAYEYAHYMWLNSRSI